MAPPSIDNRSPERRAMDEEIANEPKLPIPEIPPGTIPRRFEEVPEFHSSKPVACEGIYENGVVRLLDDSIQIPEHARVIVLAAAK
jgi:hypothetical protein